MSEVKEVPKGRHKNTRAMAWIAVFVAFLGYPAAYWFNPTMEGLATPVYSLCGSIIVIGYFGITNAADAWGPNWRR